MILGHRRYKGSGRVRDVVRVDAAAAAPPRNKNVPIGGGGEDVESSVGGSIIV